MFNFRRHRIARLASLTAAVASVAALAASPAQALSPTAPQATQLEKVSSLVQPSIVYLQTKWSGLIKDEQGQYLTDKPIETGAGCTGFVVNPSGFIGTAGHCVDQELGAQMVVNAFARALFESDPQGWAARGVTDPQQLADYGKDHWTVVGAQPPHTEEPDRVVVAAYGVDVSGLKTGKALPARVLASTDMENGDVALIKIEAEDLPALELAPTARIEVGTQVVSVGYPGSVNLVADQSFNPSFKDGAISSKKTVRNGLRAVYEISAAVSGGMSGGPTVDANGRVVGVNSFGIVGEPQAFNFISPASEIARLMRDEGVRNELGPTNRIYRGGLTAYYAGDRETALARFTSVLDVQPSHEFARSFRVKTLRMPVASEDGGLSAGLIAAIALGILGLGALAMATIRRHRGLPPFPDMGRKPEPIAPAGAFVEPRGAVIVQDGPLAGRRFPIGTELVIGRQHADIDVDDPQVSRRHAALRPIEGGIEVEDLGSANGTNVNGVPVVGSRRLRQGDTIEVGRIRLVADVAEPRRQDTLLPGLRRDAILVVKDGPFVGHRYPIAGEILIGREAADVVFDDAQVSRRHALVRPVRGGLEIEDLRSANGTRVNGERVETTRALRDGDVVTIGRVNLEVQIATASRNGRGSADPQATVLGAER